MKNERIRPLIGVSLDADGCIEEGLREGCCMSGAVLGHNLSLTEARALRDKLVQAHGWDRASDAGDTSPGRARAWAWAVYVLR